MIRLRDNRFDAYARKFTRSSDHFKAEMTFDGFSEHVIEKDPDDVLKILERYSGKTLPELRNLGNGKVITLGKVKAESNDEPAFFSLRRIGKDHRSNVNALPDPNEIQEENTNEKALQPSDSSGKDHFALDTSNLMGVLRLRHPNKETAVQMEIHSRFDRDDRQLFLNYLLSRVFQVDFIDLISAGSDHLWNILVAIMFIRKLKEAIPVGLYKEYKLFEENDLNFRGRLDLARHLRRNFPVHDKIAYSYRAITFDNPLNHLLRSALDFIRKKWPNLLTSDPDIRDFVSSLISATPTWHPGITRDLLRQSVCNEPIRHPYFAEYYEEPRVLAKMILEEDGLSIYNCNDADEVSGVIFDGAWLWEEYIATLLSPLGFLHAEYRKAGLIQLFEPTGKVGMDYIYPDFYNKKHGIVLDTKYKNSTAKREDIFQVLSYAFITGSNQCGLIFPPQGPGKMQEAEIRQNFCPEKKAMWKFFTFAQWDGDDITAHMLQQENSLKEYVEKMINDFRTGTL